MKSPPKCNLLTIPFAGGNSHSYNSLRRFLPSNIDLRPMELPGRGTRSSEQILSDMNALAEDLYWHYQDEILSGERYAILGHSMGAMLGTILTKKILADKLPPPAHLFVSGRMGPACRFACINKVSALAGDEFIGWVRRSGTPFAEALEDAEVAQFFEPVLRGDFQACEEYVYCPTPPVPVPITVLHGIDENTTPAQLHAWQLESSRPIKTYGFSGGHFFIYDHFPAIALLISHSLSGYHR